MTKVIETEAVEVIEKADSTELVDVVIPEGETGLSLMTKENGLQFIIDAVMDKSKHFKYELSTAKGRKAIKSNAHKIARVKTRADEIAKKVIADLEAEKKKITQELQDQVDTAKKERARIKTVLQGVQDETKKVVLDWEDIEKKRTDKIQGKLIEISSLCYVKGMSSNEIQGRIDQLNETGVTEEEFEEKAQTAQELIETTLATLTEMLPDVIEAEEKDRELAELKKLAADLELKEKEERIKREAEDKARAKAAEDAEERARQAGEREAKLKQEIEEKERQAQEASRVAKQELEEKRKEEARLSQERQADREHRRKINRGVINGLSKAGDINEEQATKILKAVVQGDIPNTKIIY